MANPVVHFEIFGKNRETLRSFYTDAFGWEFGEPAGPNDYMLVTTGGEGAIGGGMGVSPDQTHPGHVTFYISVPDVGKALETVAQHGGTIVMGPDLVPGGPVIGMFRDPEGHFIGLAALAPQA
jgi:predicted enzyme related to lactoylglutathione lyase